MIKIRASFCNQKSALLATFEFLHTQMLAISKNTYFTGVPAYNQIINLLDREEIIKISHSIKGSESYVKRFEGYQHLIVMFFSCTVLSIITRFISFSVISATFTISLILRIFSAPCSPIRLQNFVMSMGFIGGRFWNTFSPALP